MGRTRGAEGEALAPPQLPVADGDDQHGDEHDHQQHRVEQAWVGGVVVEDDRLEDAEADAGQPTRSAATPWRRSPRPQACGSAPLARARPCWRRWPRPAARLSTVATAARPPASDQTIVDMRFTLMPDRRAASVLSAEAPDGDAISGAVEKVGQPGHEEREHHGGHDVVRPHDDVVEDDPVVGEGRREGDERRDVRQHELEEEQKLGGSDRRDKEDDAGGSIQPPHDHQLEQAAEQCTDPDHEDERDVEVPVPVDDEAHEERRRAPRAHRGRS